MLYLSFPSVPATKQCREETGGWIAWFLRPRPDIVWLARVRRSRTTSPAIAACRHQVVLQHGRVDREVEHAVASDLLQGVASIQEEARVPLLTRGRTEPGGRFHPVAHGRADSLPPPGGPFLPVGHLPDCGQLELGTETPSPSIARLSSCGGQRTAMVREKLTMAVVRSSGCSPLASKIGFGANTLISGLSADKLSFCWRVIAFRCSSSKVGRV